MVRQRESSGGNPGLSGVRFAVALVAALLAAITYPVVAEAQPQQVITSSGPYTAIYLDDDLGCQVQASGDDSPSFFGGTDPGACGTFLAIPTQANVSSSMLFGPSPPSGVSPTPYTPVSQSSVTGAGTSASPYTVTTTVTADDSSSTPLASVTETATYVVGQPFYDTTIAVTNQTRTTLTATLYHAGDCFLANLDTGYGAYDSPTNSPVCTLEPNNNPHARIMAFSPLGTADFAASAANYIEGLFSTVWSDVTSDGTQFPDTVDGTTNEDNGMGLSWALSMASKQTQTMEVRTTVSPSSPPRSSANAPACVPSGQIPVTVTAVNGPKQVDYILDGGSQQSVPTDSSGNATIVLPAGYHTLEYWGEDLTGAQETPHHTAAVTVASGGPSLTITSDQGKSSYQVGDLASVTIAASGPHLTNDPSAAHVPISTAQAGTFSVARTAADACGTTNATFTYTVSGHGGSGGAPPPPVLGKTANVALVSGQVFVKLPAGAASTAPRQALRSLSTPWPATASQNDPWATSAQGKGVGFIPLIQARQIPVGSMVDTTAGVARVTTATAQRGKTQSGDFGAGLFKLLQNRKLRGLTQLNLVDPPNVATVCATAGKANIARRISNKVLALLKSSAKGRFSTRGHFSAATVRGTIWGIRDRCDGTLTRVTRGRVVVRDFRRHKTITLSAGKSYLAKAPGA